MQQYFIQNEIKLNDIITFNDEQSHHISRVLRMKEASVVKVVDIHKQAFLTRLFYEDKVVKGNVYEHLEDNSSSFTITLIQGMIKKDKWDFLIQKCSELGVTNIVPMISSRTIVKIDKEDTKKLERYNKIALEACEQCKRNDLVQILNPIKFKDSIHYKSDLNIVAYEDAEVQALHIKKTLQQHPNISSITFVVGSEGGLSKDEVNYLVEHDFHCVSLGNRILRAETAAMMVVNVSNYHYEINE